MNGPLPPIVLDTFAADLACDVRDLLENWTTITLFRPMPGRRRFPIQPVMLNAMTIGAGAVICVDAETEPWARKTLLPLSPDQVFSQRGALATLSYLTDKGMGVFGPFTSYLCTSSTLRPTPRPKGFCYELLRGEQIATLYSHEGLQMSLSYYVEGDRPDVIAAAAWRDGELAGVAACSADNDHMWQVGIDTRPAYRNLGLGKSLVYEVTRAILDAGKVPYYACGMHNLASQRIAASVGYFPAWTTMCAKSQA